jgi:hypothetical protein
MRSHTHDTPPSSANAFDRAFLDILDPEDDPVTATEAAAEGPWTVVRFAAPKIPFAEPHGAPSSQAEPWAVVHEGEPADSEPAATFVHLHPARLAAAAVSLTARDAAYRLDSAQTARGFALRRDGRVAGHLPWHQPELVATLNVLDALARSPRALATLLEAAGATAVRRVGELLARRSA